ncbi:3106_t:CDS:2, partial [Funneliformis geosporum]
KSNLEVFASELKINLEAVYSLNKHYQRLLFARKERNRTVVEDSEEKIAKTKQDLLTSKISIENVRKISRECEKLAGLSNKSLEEREKANEEMRKVNKSYEVLGDGELRRKYDLGLTDFPTDDFSFQYDPKEEIRRQEEELRRREINIVDLELELLKLEMKALDRSSILNEIGAAFCFTLPRVRAEDLDPILWQPYQSWGEKVVKMEINIPKGKDRSEELKSFKEEMIKAIKEAETTLRIREENKKKSEDDSELNQTRTVAFQEIEKLMNERGLKIKDLGQYSNYQERINKLGEVERIRNFREEVLEPRRVFDRRDEPRNRIEEDRFFLSGIRDKTRNKELEENNKALKLKVTAPQASWIKQTIFGKEKQYETQIEIPPKK